MGRVLEGVVRAGLSRTQINMLINDWILSARDRKILRMKLMDGLTYEVIAEQLSPQMSPRQIKRIVRRCVEKLQEHL